MTIRIQYVQAQNNEDMVGPDLAFGALKAYAQMAFGAQIDMRRVQDASGAAYADVFAVSSVSQNWRIAQRLAAEAKAINPKCITVAGGHHVTAMPDTIGSFDHAVLGEGEHGFASLLSSLIDGVPASKLGRFVRCPWVESLDDLPSPVREDGWSYAWTSRGCPFRCRFCSSCRFWPKVRFHSASRVVREIESVSMSMGGNVWITDDLFVAHVPRMREVCDMLDERNVHPKTNYCIRASSVNDELCSYIRRLNTTHVTLGLESGSDRTLATLGKKCSVARNQRALDVLSANGVTASAFFIVGVPGETEADFHDTFDFMRDNIRAGKLAGAASFILAPWPGTPIWDDAVACGAIDPVGFDWGRIGLTSVLSGLKYNTIDSWAEERARRGIVYLGGIPQERLYELLQQREEEIWPKI